MNHYETEASSGAAGLATLAEPAEAAEAEAATADVAGADGGGTLLLADRLFEVLPRTVRRMRQETRTRFGRDLSVPQVRAVMFLRRHPGSGLSRLADHLGISAPTASVLVDGLVAQGLAMRSPDPVERRRICLALTPDGMTIAGEARTAARGWLSAALAGIAPDERSTLAVAVAILDRLTDARS